MIDDFKFFLTCISILYFTAGLIAVFLVVDTLQERRGTQFTALLVVAVFAIAVSLAVVIFGA